MIPGTASIHLIDPSPPGNGWTLLSPAERVRAASFVFPVHAARWTACRAALRRILGKIIQLPPAEVPLRISPLGKPVLAPPFDHLHFSLSHCDNLALLAMCTDGPLGVDIEPSHRSAEMPDCETSFCHPSEIADLPAAPHFRGQRLLELWVAKEATLKALGTGFTHPPESVRILGSTATSDLPLPGIDALTIHPLTHPRLENHLASLAAPSSITGIVIHLSEESTSLPSSANTSVRPAQSDG